MRGHLDETVRQIRMMHGGHVVAGFGLARLRGMGDADRDRPVGAAQTEMLDPTDGRLLRIEGISGTGTSKPFRARRAIA